MSAPEVLLVMTTLPDRDVAERMAKHLVEANLAACIQILGPMQSVYRWQGQIEQAEEYLLLIKTTTAGYSQLEESLHQAHPYELPEIVAVPAARGFLPYLQWVSANVIAAPTPV